jgi:serine/threonine-protein kinase SRPK3
VGATNGLCRQLLSTISNRRCQSNRYVALKITNCFERDRKTANEELEISQHIAGIRSKHPGRLRVRLIEDSFTIPGPSGEHLRIVLEPLREPL